MTDEWVKVDLASAFQLNPARDIAYGVVTPFIPMDAIPENGRFPVRLDERQFTGSGMRFKNGDTLVARITPCLENGKTVYVDLLPEGVVAHGSTEYIVLSGVHGKTEDLFAYYLARSPEFRRYAIGHMEGTSGRQRVSASSIARYQVNLPPIDEQRAISSILGALDDQIEQCRRISDTADAMAKAMFKSWFVDFDLARKAGVKFKDSIVGKIPEGCEVKGLDQVARFLNGLALQKYPSYEAESLSVIKIAQLRARSLVGADVASADIPSEYVISDGDVLFSWSGSLEVDLWAAGKGALNQHIFKVSSDDFPKWFYYLWVCHHLPEFRRIAAAKATTMGHIQRHHLSEAKVVVPDAKTMEYAGRHIGPLIDAYLSFRLNARDIVEIRNSLLPKLISGEVRVRNPERFVRVRT